MVGHSSEHCKLDTLPLRWPEWSQHNCVISSGACILKTDNCYGHNSELLHTTELSISVLVLVTLLALVTDIWLFSYVCWQQNNMTRILAKQNITHTVGHHVSRVLLGMHTCFNWHLTWHWKQAVSGAFLNVVVIGFAPVVTAHLTLCSDLGTFNSKNAKIGTLMGIKTLNLKEANVLS